MAAKLVQFCLLAFILVGSEAWEWNLGQIRSIKMQPRGNDHLYGELPKKEYKSQKYYQEEDTEDYFFGPKGSNTGEYLKGDGEYLKQDDYSFDSASYGGEVDKDSFKMGRNEIPRNDGINSEVYSFEPSKDIKDDYFSQEKEVGIGERLSDYFFGPKGSNTGEYLKEESLESFHDSANYEGEEDKDSYFEFGRNADSNNWSDSIHGEELKQEEKEETQYLKLNGKSWETADSNNWSDSINGEELKQEEKKENQYLKLHGKSWETADSDNWSDSIYGEELKQEEKEENQYLKLHGKSWETTDSDNWSDSIHGEELKQEEKEENQYLKLHGKSWETADSDNWSDSIYGEELKQEEKQYLKLHGKSWETADSNNWSDSIYGEELKQEEKEENQYLKLHGKFLQSDNEPVIDYDYDVEMYDTAPNEK